MVEPLLSGPEDALGATSTTRPVDGGTLVAAACAPAVAPDLRRLYRLAALDVPDDTGPAFAAGFWYARDGAAPFGPVATLPFPYYTYRKTKWRRCVIRDETYHAAAHLKFPLLAAYSAAGERWHGLLFQPYLDLAGRRLPVYVRVGAAGALRRLSVGVCFGAEVHVDRHPWFGFGTTTRRAMPAAATGAAFEFAYAEIEARDWPELMALACRTPLLPQPPPQPAAPPRRLHEAMDRAWRFLYRAEDAEYGALVHLLRRGAPGQVSEEFKHSHVTPELHALELGARLGQADAAAARFDRWTAWALPGVRRIDGEDACWWHTTTRRTPRGLAAFTHHGAGFVGFPGGQATNVRHVAEAYQATGDDRLADAALAGARWVRRRQRDDGAWPATVPVPGAVRLKPVAGDRPCVAATAESVRALLAAYAIDGDRAWLDAAETGLGFVNRAAACFEATGYLRDAAPEEPDGLTAECAVHANLDRARFGPAEPYAASARRWAWYGVQWTRPLAAAPQGTWTVDGLGHTITPRIDVWGALLLGGAWMRLGEVTEDPFWTRLAWRQLEACLALQERDGGFAETWWYDWPGGLCPVPIESTFLVLAFLDLACRFAGTWQPPAPLVAPQADTPMPGALAGPAGLSFAFGEVAYTRPLEALHRRFLDAARRHGPRSLAARTLGFAHLLTGGDTPPAPASARPLRHWDVRHGAPAATDGSWRTWFAVARSTHADNGPAVPHLAIQGADTIGVTTDSLVVGARDGTHWRVTVNANGNVLAEADGTFHFEYAANWADGTADFAGEIVCLRQDDAT